MMERVDDDWLKSHDGKGGWRLAEMHNSISHAGAERFECNVIIYIYVYEDMKTLVAHINVCQRLMMIWIIYVAMSLNYDWGIFHFLFFFLQKRPCLY